MDSSSLLTVQSGTEKYIFERLFSEQILKYSVDPTFSKVIHKILHSLDKKKTVLSKTRTQCHWLMNDRQPLYPSKSSASE